MATTSPTSTTARPPPARYRFGGLVLDTGRRRLTDGHRSVQLGRLTFDLLQALVEAAPNAVSHDELARRVWGARPVSPETLSQRVKLLRDALSDDAEDPKYVEVIRGHGHRLIPPVRPLRQWTWSTDWRDPLPLTALAMAGLALLASISLWLVTAETPAAIAVVPFSLAGDTAVDDDGIGEDLAEEVIYQLSQLNSLRVFPSSATFAFRDNVGELHATDSGLGVSHVLKGSVQRTDGSVRVTAQLIECATGYQIWSGTREYGSEDPAVAQRLANYVVREIEIALASDAMLAEHNQKELALALGPG